MPGHDNLAGNVLDGGSGRDLNLALFSDGDNLAALDDQHSVLDRR